MRSFISSHRRGSSAESGSYNPLNLTNIEENDKNTTSNNTTDYTNNYNNNNNHSLKPSLMPATGIFSTQTSPSKLLKINSQLQHISSSPQKTSPLKETVLLPPTKPSSGVYSSPTTPLMDNESDVFGSPHLNSTVTKNSSSKSLDLNRGNYNDKSSSPSAFNLHTKSPKKSRNPIKNFLKQRVSSSNLHSMASPNSLSNSSSSPNLNYTEPQGLYTLNPHGSRNNSSPKIKQKASFSNLSSLTAPLTKKKSSSSASMAPPSHKSTLTSSTSHWLSGGIPEYTSSPTIYGTLTHNWGSDEPNKNASPRLFRDQEISKSNASLVSSEDRVNPIYLNSTNLNSSKGSLSRVNNFHESNNTKKDNSNELTKVNSTISTGSQLSALSLVPETIQTTLSTSVTPIDGSIKSKTNGETLKSTFGRKEGLVSESDLNTRDISTLSNESVGDFSIVVINKKKKNKSLKSVTISDQVEVDNFRDNTGAGLYDEDADADADENDNASFSSSSNFSFQENSKKGRNASIKYYKSSEQMKYEEQKLRTADYQRHMQNYIEDEGIGEDGLGEGMNYVDFDEEDETEALFNRNLFSSDEEDNDNDNLNKIETGNLNDTHVAPDLTSSCIPVQKLSEDYENFSSDFDSDEENNNELDDNNIDNTIYSAASTDTVKRIEKKEVSEKSNKNSDKSQEHAGDYFLYSSDVSEVKPEPIPSTETEPEVDKEPAPSATPVGLFPNNEIFNLLRQLESSEEVRASSINSSNNTKPRDIPVEKQHIEHSTSVSSKSEIEEIVSTDNVVAKSDSFNLQEQNHVLSEFPKPKTPDTVILQQSPVLKPKTTASESLALRSRKPSIKYHQVLSSMDSDMKFLNKRYSWFPNDEAKKLNRFKNTKHYDYSTVKSNNINDNNFNDSNNDNNSRMGNIDESSSNDENTGYASPEPQSQFVDGFYSPASTIKNEEELLFNDIVRSVPNGESSDTASNNSSLSDKFEDSLLDEINQVPEDYEFEESDSEYQNHNNTRFQAPSLPNNRIFNNRTGSFNSMHTNSFNKSSHPSRSDSFPINTRSRGSLRSFLNKSSLKSVNDPRASSLTSTSSGNRIELKDKTVTLFNTVPSRNNSFKSDFNYPGSIISDSLDSRCNSYDNKSNNGNNANNKGNSRFQDMYNIANVNISGDVYSSNDDFAELDNFRNNTLSISNNDQTSNEDHGLTTITESGYSNKH
ncbi:hypothetical protein B5S28_g3138 [[Candida] boidinii]|nr:hypothetical protein B5S28_g3138 [[Candida] boidinii]